MEHKLSITRREPNPAYKAPKSMGATFAQRYDIPQYSTYNVLDVEVSPEQFEAIRKAVLENF